MHPTLSGEFKDLLTAVLRTTKGKSHKTSILELQVGKSELNTSKCKLLTRSQPLVAFKRPLSGNI